MRLHSMSLCLCSLCYLSHAVGTPSLTTEVVFDGHFNISYEWTVYTEFYFPDRYYSNACQRFMTYENTPGDSYLHQRSLLMTAFKLSRVLNRVLILPAFYCKDIRCCFTDRFKGQYVCLSVCTYFFS